MFAISFPNSSRCNAWHTQSMDSYQHPMPKTPELSYINFMPSPKTMAVFNRGASLQDPSPPPPNASKTQGSTPDFKWQGWSKDFQCRDFFWVFKTIWRFVVSARVLRPPSPINCFYFSCYFNAFWEFLRFRNSAWELLEVWFLLPFDHPRHLKSVVSSPGPRKSNTFRFQINQPINLTQVWARYFSDRYISLTFYDANCKKKLQGDNTSKKKPTTENMHRKKQGRQFHYTLFTTADTENSNKMTPL